MLNRNRIHKVLPLVLILALSLLLSGCLKMDIDMTIKSNGKADVSILYAAEDSMTEMSEGETESGVLSQEQIDEYKAKGWEVSDYAKDGYTGVVVSKKDQDMAEAKLLEGSNSNVRKEGSIYIIDIDVFGEEKSMEMNQYASMLSAAGGSFTFRLTLPTKPIRHNATSVSEDGKTLTWDFLSMDPGDTVHVEFKMPSSIAMYIVIGVLVAIVAVLLLLKKKRKGDDATEDVVEAASAAVSEAAGATEETVATPENDAAEAVAEAAENVTEE